MHNVSTIKYSWSYKIKGDYIAQQKLHASGSEIDNQLSNKRRLISFIAAGCNRVALPCYFRSSSLKFGNISASYF